MCTTPCDDVNSVISKPQPPCERIKRRNTVSVTPAIGARTVAGDMGTGPIEKPVGNVTIVTPIVPGSQALELTK
ncbi:hypothetical protein F183_A31480 [Bryobacterales bacterium F-183]|nr:hypothetical protein F183_A31480 [Bryobacterales bacterium F-183]